MTKDIKVGDFVEHLTHGMGVVVSTTRLIKKIFFQGIGEKILFTDEELIQLPDDINSEKNYSFYAFLQDCNYREDMEDPHMYSILLGIYMKEYDLKTIRRSIV